MKFAELATGSRFDFVDDAMPTLNSFHDRCEKISPRKYRSLESGIEMRVSTINADVWHVDLRKSDGK
jgi:hypothetical protein